MLKIKLNQINNIDYTTQWVLEGAGQQTHVTPPH